MIWPRVSKQDPCPICNHGDWCTFGDRAVKCMRVVSVNSSSDGGWYHFYDANAPRPEFVPRWKPPVNNFLNVDSLISIYRTNTELKMRKKFAETLGVSDESLEMLGVAWCVEKNAWAFPMSDEKGNKIGIRLRSASGFKWAVPGSKQGIFLPLIANQIAFLPEGPTDTAALLTLGLFAIGRPNCSSGGEILKLTLRRLGVRRAVIVADNDELKKNGNGETRPGITGALKLKRELSLPSVIYIPPTKDIREFVRKGGTAQMIETDLKNKIWTTK